MKAMAACAAAGGCTLSFPRPAGRLPLQAGPPGAPPPYHPYGPAVVAVYRTSAINLTSHLTLVIPVPPRNPKSTHQPGCFHGCFV